MEATDSGGLADQFVDEVIDRLRERGYDGERFRGADEVEVFRTDQYLRWMGRAQAWMGRGEGDFSGLLKQEIIPMPSEGARQIASAVQEESAAFERDAAFFDESVRSSSDYVERYVAVHDGAVLDSDSSVDELVARILARPNGKDLLRKALIERAGQTPDSAT